MATATIKRKTTTEDNVSAREVWYEVYFDDEFVFGTDDVCVAMDVKADLDAGYKVPADFKWNL